MIELQNEKNYAIREDRLREAARAVLRAQNIESDAEITVVITNDDAVAALNERYRQITAPTDVLSFRLDVSAMPGEAQYLGDLVIAYPYASAQAAREGHDLHDSLALLVVHGTLHLLGFDHDTPENREIMWTAQANALRELGISAEIVPALEDDHE